MARELLSKPDEFITVTLRENEYSIKGIKRVYTHANIDDGTTHLTLQVGECNEGNIIR